MTRKEFLGFAAVTIASAFGITGLIKELASHASTPTAEAEPETGTVTAPAAVVSDTTASNQKAIKFGSGSTGTIPAPIYGGAFGGNSVPTSIETQAGRTVGMRRTYWEGGQTSQGVAAASADIASHRVPWVSFKLPDTWANAKNGACDAWAKNICAQLGALNGPVMLTWHHEPEADESPITDFIAMHERLYQFSKQYSNIKCGPIFTAYDWLYGPTQAPGTYAQYQLSLITASIGDFIGWDSYCYYGTAKNGKWWFLGPEYLTPIANQAKSIGLDWAIGEYGISATGAAYNRSITGGNASGTAGGDITWLREVYNTSKSLSTASSRCLALCYFDSGLNSVNNTSVNPSGTVIGGGATNGHPAWPLETQVVGGTTYPADSGTPSKLDVFVDILKQSPAWRSTWQ
jgi:hypothetical protein